MLLAYTEKMSEMFITIKCQNYSVCPSVHQTDPCTNGSICRNVFTECNIDVLTLNRVVASSEAVT